MKTLSSLFVVLFLSIPAAWADSVEEAQWHTGAGAERVVDNGQILDADCDYRSGPGELVRTCFYSVLYSAQLWDCRMKFDYREDEVQFVCITRKSN